MSPLPAGTVTFLFTDIEGSTQLWERLPGPMQAALGRHDDLLRAAVEGHHGYVFKTTGDGLHAVFESAANGLLAAVAAQRALQAEPWGATGPLKIRLALHSGEAEARAGDYFGPALNRTARLMSVAAGGQMLLSAITADLVRAQLPPGLALRDLGEHRLKDLIRPEHVFQLTAPDLPADFPALKTLNSFPNNLPVQLTRFIGRERELAEVRRLLLANRLLTLTGPGGTGKTRLALQLAADSLPAFADGVWFVELAPLADPAQVLQTVAAVWNVREQRGLSLLDSVLNYVRAKELALVLDNCEHLVQACAQLADQCLHAGPSLKIIASSREALGISGETVYKVPSLGLPHPAPAGQAAAAAAEIAGAESVQLFVERALAANPRFVLTDRNAAAVAGICRLLDGIPLALELAAARVTVFSPEQIAARLNDRFRLLTGGSRTALPRQQTLRALIDWSYDSLSQPERALLRRLSVFNGGWTFEAAEGLCPDLDVLNGLSQLVNKSLVNVEDEGAQPRYRLLETIRQYGREKLVEAGELDHTCQRHLELFVSLAEAAGDQVDSRETEAWAPGLEAEYDNLRAALEWALDHDVEAALRLVAVLFAFWFRHGRMVEGLNWIGAALARAETLPALAGEAGQRQMWLRAQAWQAMASLAHMNDNLAALKASQAASALARQLGDTRMLTKSLAITGTAHYMLSDPRGARAPIEESLALARQTGDNYSLGIALNAMAGYSALVAGDPEAAAHYEAEGLALLSGYEATWGGIFAFVTSARAATDRGDYSTARARYLAFLPRMQQLGDEHRLNMIASELGHLERYEGHPAAAEAAYRQTIRVWQKLGHRAAVAHQLESFAFTARAQGQPERAARLLGAAARLREQIGIPMGPVEHVEYERELAGLRGSLPEPGLAALWAAGQAMSLEAAVDYAVAVS